MVPIRAARVILTGRWRALSKGRWLRPEAGQVRGAHPGFLLEKRSDLLGGACHPVVPDADPPDVAELEAGLIGDRVDQPQD